MAHVTVHVVPHTHWDREWYASFAAFRHRLVHTVDRLLDILDTEPGYRFMLDGQTAMVDDYLEIRPERLADLRRHAAAGRLDVGPWTTLADSFLVSGETLVRNMRHGLARAAAIAEPMAVGHLPDMFGHAAQMPQLLRLFGFERAVLWRGVPSGIDRTFFRWKSPDGSEVLVGYLCASYSNAVEIPIEADALRERIEGLLKEQAPFGPPGHVLAMNGTDHWPPQRGLPEAFEKLNATANGVRAELSSLTRYFDAASPHLEGLPEWTGELRSGARANVLMGVTSTRVDLKRVQAEAERLLERYAEPLCAVLAVAGTPAPPQRLFDLAWKNLVLNAAHDSVCSCSSDETMESVSARYHDARTIAARLRDDAVRTLAENVDASGPGVVVWNPSPFARAEQVELEVTLPPEIPPAVPLAVEDSAGNRHASVEISRDTRDLRAPTVRLLTSTPAVPGLGWETLRVVGGTAAPPGPGLASGRTLDNGILRVEVDDDGTFRVNGLAGFGRIEDGGDAGDSYNWSPPPRDRPVDDPVGVEVTVPESTPLRGRLLVRRTFAVPRSLTADEQGRSEEDVPLTLDTVLTLRAGTDRLDVEVEFENTARDHRLRMRLPLPAAVAGSAADTAFGAVERGLDTEGSAQELPLPTWPAKRFVALGRLGVLLDQTLEYEVVDSGTAVMLTLLRATGYISRPAPLMRPNPAGPKEPIRHAQSLGPQRVAFGVLVRDPASRDPLPEIVAAADAYAHPFAVAPPAANTGRTLPARGVPVSIEAAGDVCLSALTLTGAGLEARLYNTAASPRPVDASAQGTGEARRVDLRGNEIEADGLASFQIGTWLWTR